MLFAPGTIALYSSVHALLTLSGAGDALLQIGSAPGTGMAMDLGIAAIDGICRSEGIALLGVQAVRNHYNPVIASSPFAMILAGTLVGGGAPLLISTFDLGSAQWQLGTPGWLTQPFGLLAIDIWSAALLSALYAGLTSPAGFKSLTGSLPSVFRAHFTTHVGPHLKIATDAAERLLMLRSADSSGIAEKIANAASASASAIAGRPLLSASEARVVCGLLLFAIFALNRVGRPLLGSILGGNRNGLKGAGKTKIGGGPQTPTSASSTKASGRARIQNGSPSSAASPSPALRRSSRKTQ